MLEIAKDKPAPDPEIQKCIDYLNESNKKGEIVGLGVAVVGTVNAHTTQHIAGKYNVAMMLGSVAFLQEMVLEERTPGTTEDY